MANAMQEDSHIFTDTLPKMSQIDKAYRSEYYSTIDTWLWKHQHNEVIMTKHPQGNLQKSMVMRAGNSKDPYHTRLLLITPLFATVGLWVSVSHDQMLFQPCA